MGYHQGEEETVYDQVLGDIEIKRDQEGMVQANAYEASHWLSFRQIS
jgi:hypothetical protein